ncbi:MAG TPA: PP2C family protein-serine/threonine phosphatase [Thermoanaerobaculia bacterium]|nr:PP2C family protein-serine/threonine phosphatase [Thermoanaerobaculia bacterium]
MSLALAERPVRLPTVAVPERPTFHAVSRPATALSGDFYLAHPRSDGWLLGLGDVAGHGLDAAVFMLMIQEEIERLAHAGASLPLLVAELHMVLRRELPSRSFVSLVLVRLEPDGGLEALNAGHCPPLLRRADGMIEPLLPGGPIVGALPCSRWTSRRTRLGAGDTLLVFSDGVTETTSRAGEEFGMGRIGATLWRHGSLEPRRLAERLLDELEAFRGGAAAHDDTTVLVARAVESAAAPAGGVG